MDGFYVFVGNPVTGEIADKVISNSNELRDAIMELGVIVDCERPLWASYDASGISYSDAEMDFNNYFSREILMDELFVALSA